LVTLYIRVQFSLLANYMAFGKIIGKVVVKFRYWVGLMDVEYGHAE